MSLRQRIITTVIMLFFLVLSAAAASSSLNDALPALPPTSSPTPPILATLNDAFYPDFTNTSTPDLITVPEPDLVQVAYDTIPDEQRMRTAWQGKATIEVYMLSEPFQTVGNVTGSALYNIVWQTLATDCPIRIGRQNNKKCWNEFHPFPTRYRKDGGSWEESLNQIHVESSYFTNLQTRNLLIGSIAGALQSVTEMARNCFSVKDSASGNRYCNVPMKIGAYTKDSHIAMALTSDIIDDNDGSFHCCDSREAVDAKLDELKSEFLSVYSGGQNKFRLVECHLGCRDDQREENVDVDKLLIEMISLGL